MGQTSKRGRRWAVLALTGAMVCASALSAGGSAQASAAGGGAQAFSEPVGTAALPAYWSDYGQHIINYSGKCLQPQSRDSQARVVQTTCVQVQPLQRWKVIESGSGHAMLQNQGSGLCMDLFVNSEAEVVAGVHVQQFSCWNGYTSEQFSRSRGSRYQHFQVITRIRSLCLDVRGGSTSDGAQIEIQGCDYYRNSQQFKFVDASW